MDSKKKFLSLNTVKKQLRETDRREPFSNYIQFSPKTIHEKLVSDYNFNISHSQRRAQNQVEYERSLVEYTNKLTSRKIQFDLNERLNSFTNQSYTQAKIRNDNPSIKGILKASNLANYGKSVDETFPSRNVYTYFSKENVGPTIKRGINENLIKKNRLSEIKEKIKNSGRFVPESRLKTDPFSNYVKSFLLVKGEQNNFLKMKIDTYNKQVKNNSSQMDAFSNYCSLRNNQNNLKNNANNKRVSLDRPRSKHSTQNDLFENYYYFKEQEHSSNLPSQQVQTKDPRRYSSVLGEKDYFSFNQEQKNLQNISIQTKTNDSRRYSSVMGEKDHSILNNKLQKEEYAYHSKNPPKLIENLNQKISNNILQSKDSNSIVKDLKNPSNGTLSCKIFLRNPQSNNTKIESKEKENSQNQSNFQNNKVNFISKSCLINQTTKIVLENNDGRRSVCESINNTSRSSSLPQKYRLTDVKKAIIFSKIPPFIPPINPVRDPNMISNKKNINSTNNNNNINIDKIHNINNNSNNIKYSNNKSNFNNISEKKTDSVSSILNEENDLKRLKRLVIPSDATFQNSLFKKNVDLDQSLNNQNKETYQARKENHETAAKLMNDLMKKLSQYFNDEFEKLTKFNQFMYMTYIENKKKLRKDILEDLSKLTKFEQEVLLEYCKKLYSKSSKTLKVKPESHNGIKNILESYDSQSDLRQKLHQSNVGIKNIIPTKSPANLNEIKNHKKNESSADSITEKYILSNDTAKENNDKKTSHTPTNMEFNLKAQKFHSLKSISVDNDFKKYIDDIRASLNSEKIKSSLNSNLNMDKYKNISKSQNQMDSTHVGVKKSSLKDQNKTSDYSTGSESCTYSKLSENKYANSSNKNRCSSIDESKTHLFINNNRNKIEVGDESIKKVVTYSSLVKCIGEIGKPLNNPIYDSKILVDNDKKSLKIEIINNTSKKDQRKRDLSSARFLNSQNLIENENFKFPINLTNNQHKCSPYFANDNCHTLKDNSIEEFTKNFTEDNKNTNKRLSQIEMKFLNLRRNIEMYSDINRVFIH